MLLDPLAEQERAKYRKVWRESKLYREHSPGLRHAPEALDFFRGYDLTRPSLTDFGCGDGRALDWFDESGGFYFLAGIDIANERTDAPVIVSGCLWDPVPSWLRSEFGYCCDVLEHIPPDKIGAVLRELRAAIRVAGWFQIALFEDTAGSEGDWGTLHLSVFPASEWLAWVALAGFNIVHFDTDGKRLKLRVE